MPENAEFFRFFLKENGKLVTPSSGLKVYGAYYEYKKHKVGAQYSWQVQAARMIGRDEVQGNLSLPITFTVSPDALMADVEVDQPTITLSFYDYAQEDGDRIDVMLNGNKIISNMTLKNAAQTRRVTLLPGRNMITIKALNTGSATPNTAAIRVSNVLSGPDYQTWSLWTDETAGFSIRYVGGGGLL